MRVVTGVHRSGTSFVAMILDALGMEFGDHGAFYAADQWNEEGYFERRDIIDLNSRIITGFPRTTGRIASIWSQVRYVLQPAPSSIDRRARALRDEIDRTAAGLGGVLVKDPRFALTLPAWKPHVQDVVVSLRRPDQVAHSLKRRQRIPLWVSYRFWDYHARALLSIDHHKVHYVDFDVLASESPGAELESLAQFLGVSTPSSDLTAALRARFVPELKHFDADIPVNLPRSTRQLWEALASRRDPAGA